MKSNPEMGGQSEKLTNRLSTFVKYVIWDADIYKKGDENIKNPKSNVIEVNFEKKRRIL